ncbi:MAG: beta strand repeat-containing protein, partial [Planctomycetota bacterium]
LITLEAGGVATFNGTVGSQGVADVPSGLRVIGDSVFNANLGTQQPLLALIVDGMATYGSNVDTVLTIFGQRYNGPTFINSNLTMESTSVALPGSIRFEDTLDRGTQVLGGPHTLTIDTAGDTIFNGLVGGTNAGLNIHTIGGGTTFIGNDMNAAALDFDDAVELTASSTLTGTNLVDFGSTVNGATFDLTINSPLTSFNGAVTDVGTLTTDADGTTNVNANISGGSLFFNDTVALGGGGIPLRTLTGTGAVTLGNGVIGNNFSLAVATPGLTTLGGDFGGLNVFTVTGPSQINSSTTIGANTLTLLGALQLDGALTVNATNAAFAAIMSGNQSDLTVNATTVFNGAVAGLGTLNANGATTITTDVDGLVLNFNDALTVAGNATIGSAGTTQVLFGGPVAGQAGTEMLTVLGPTMLNGDVSNLDLVDFQAAVALGGAGIPLRTVSATSGVNFTGGVTGNGYSLTVNTPGTAMLVGLMTGLNALDLSGAGNTTTTGDTTIQAQSVVFSPLTLGGELTLGADGTPVGTVTFGNVTGNGHDLLVFGNNTSFNGTVTGVGTLATDEAGTTTIAADMTADRLVFLDAVQLVGSRTLTSTVNAVNFGSTVTGDNNDLTINGADAARFFGNVSGINTLMVTAPTILLTDASITTLGDQTYMGDLAFGTLGGNPLTTLTGPNVFFMGLVDSQGAIAAPSGLLVNGNARFGGNVGTQFGGLGLLSLEVTGATLFDLGATQVNTVNAQIYGGPVAVSNNLNMRSSFGQQIVFNGTLDRSAGAFGLPLVTIDTAGDTVFNGVVGGNLALGGINTIGGGTTFINGGSMTATMLDFDDAVSLGSAAVLNGNGMVDFASTVVGNGNDLTVNSPVTGFHGAVSGINVLFTDAAGVTTIDDTSIAAQQVIFGDAVLVNNSGFVSGNQLVDFGSSVDGAGANLTVRSNERINFRGDVGAIAALRQLDAEACRDGTRNEIVFFGNRSVRTVGGDIILNGAGRAAPGSVASIASTGSLLLDATGGGSVRVGQNEKLTAVGNLTINGATATFGDLNSGGNIFVNAGAINIWRRQPSTVLTASGAGAQDLGADLVALGSMNFSVAPTFIGFGATPLAAAGGGITNPGGLIIRPLSSVLSTTLVNPNGTILDLAIANAGGDELATALDEDTPGMVDDRTPKDPVLERAMEELSIFIRDIEDHELLSHAYGAAIYTDHRQTGMTQEQLEIVHHRLNHKYVLGVLDQYATIFLVETTDPDTGEVTTEKRTTELAETLATAWQDYRAANSETPFREWLEQSETHGAALAEINDLRTLFRDVEIMGTTPREQLVCMRGVCEEIIPADMTEGEFFDAIDPRTGG